jgi:hypothetical protein
MALAELGHFSAPIALLAGLAAALGTARHLRSVRSPIPEGGGLVLIFALAASVSLLPTIDTTLLSQDASVHLAAGRWLARTGSLAIPDPSLEGLSRETRLGLFEISDVGARLSQARLPGGIVLPRLTETVAYPSLSHLIEIWIATADRIAGTRAIRALPLLFAVSAWWAIGLVASLEAGVAAGFAAVAMLASWLPQHWFARFLMPETLNQALIWSAMAAAQIALRCSEEQRLIQGSGNEGRIAAWLTGICLGLAGFARLEQVLILLPALWLARAWTDGRENLLPRGALIPFVLTSVHAGLHLAIVPTDYGNRIGQVMWSALGRGFTALGGTWTHAFTAFALALLVVVVGWLGLRRLENRLLLRLTAGVLGIAGFTVLYHRDVPADLPAFRWLAWYVPWPVWVALALRPAALRTGSGLGLALTIEAVDQLMNPRVSPEQIWGSRRLVTIVLPLIALAAARVVAAPSSPRTVRVDRLRRLLLGAAIVLGCVQLRHVVWHRVQAGGEVLRREIAAALPPASYVVLARSLDWFHLASALWLDGGPTTILPASYPEFPEALGVLLARRGDHDLFALAGGVAQAGATEVSFELPPLPAGYSARPLQTFVWKPRLLESTEDAAPQVLVERRAMIKLFRVERSRSEIPREAVPRTP